MNTQTHLLISAFLLARPARPRRNVALLVGALLPDLAIYLLVVWAKIQSIPEWRIWGEFYWQEPWQSLGALGNSVPLYLVGFLIALAFAYRESDSGSSRLKLIFWPGNDRDRLPIVFAVLFVSCLIHILFDFPVHVDDAHRHFWPVSDWRFVSPFSYWNPAHFGVEIQIIEFIAALVMIAALYRRFASRWVHAFLALTALFYLLVPLYWALQFG